MGENRKKILVADDEEATRTLLRRILVSRGHGVIEAADGEEALMKALSDRPDLVVADLKMPRGDGLWLIRRLKEHREFEGVPILILSGYGETEHIKAALKAGAADYLLKPFIPEELVVRLEAQLKYKALFDELVSERNRLATLVHELEASKNTIAERAKDLEAANEELAREVASRRIVEDRLHKITCAVEQSEVGIVILDRGGKVEYVNPGYVAIMGRTVDEALGQDIRLLESPAATPDDHQQMWGALQAGKRWQDDVQYRKESGKPFWVSLSISPLKAEDGKITGFAAVLEDITDRKQTEQTMTRAMEELNKANEMKSGFISIVSHELRTPLTSIKNSLDILKGGGKPLKEEDRLRFLGMAGRNVERLTRIINDLLDLNKMEAGKLEFHYAHADLRKSLEDVFSSLESEATANGIHVELDCPERLPGVWMDPPRIEQVVTNLLGNAIKFTPGGGRVVLGASPGPEEVEVSVTDSGIGISAEDKVRIFDPFYQVEPAQTRKVKGSGLGLSISKSLVRSNGGNLIVESQIGSGSRFSFRLPVHSPRAAEMTAFEQEMKQYRAYPNFSMLVVEMVGPELPEGEERAPVVSRLYDIVRKFLARGSDHVTAQPSWGRLVLVLLGVPRMGAKIVRPRLGDFLSGEPAKIVGSRLRVRGPSHFPDDGQSAWELIESAFAQDVDQK